MLFFLSLPACIVKKKVYAQINTYFHRLSVYGWIFFPLALSAAVSTIIDRLRSAADSLLRLLHSPLRYINSMNTECEYLIYIFFFVFPNEVRSAASSSSSSTYSQARRAMVRKSVKSVSSKHTAQREKNSVEMRMRMKKKIR